MRRAGTVKEDRRRDQDGRRHNEQHGKTTEEAPRKAYPDDSFPLLSTGFRRPVSQVLDRRLAGRRQVNVSSLWRSSGASPAIGWIQWGLVFIFVGPMGSGLHFPVSSPHTADGCQKESLSPRIARNVTRRSRTVHRVSCLSSLRDDFGEHSECGLAADRSSHTALLGSGRDAGIRPQPLRELIVIDQATHHCEVAQSPTARPRLPVSNPTGLSSARGRFRKLLRWKVKM